MNGRVKFNFATTTWWWRCRYCYCCFCYSIAQRFLHVLAEWWLKFGHCMHHTPLKIFIYTFKYRHKIHINWIKTEKDAESQKVYNVVPFRRSLTFERFKNEMKSKARHLQSGKNFPTARVFFYALVCIQKVAGNFSFHFTVHIMSHCKLWKFKFLIFWLVLIWFEMDRKDWCRHFQCFFLKFSWAYFWTPKIWVKAASYCYWNQSTLSNNRQRCTEPSVSWILRDNGCLLY